ncbi:cytochrome P450 [Auriculariales sp. MPI-PUGE-AT-0066]|nr:cytochrome P450 [Auriculariales sp. MPI-PUGE-AT-0066]
MESVSRPVVVGAALSALGAYVLTVSVYRIFFGPLKDIPGPWYTKISDTWLSAHSLAFHQCRAIDAVFAKYGPVVRLGPNKVGFLDADVAKTVYAKFPKDPFYLSLRMNGKDHAMTSLEPAEHIARRRGFAAHYNFDNLAIFQQSMQEFTIQVAARLTEIGGKEAVDCTEMFRHLMVDIICISGYDFKYGSVARWAAGKSDSLAVAISDWPKRSMIKDLVGPAIWAFLNALPVARLRQFIASNEILHTFAGDRVRAVRAALADGKLDEQDKHTLLVRLLQYKMPSGEGFTDGEMIAEVMAHTMAGTDTTSTLLSYAMWALATHPEAMRKLQAELDETMDDPGRIPETQVLSNLSYLNAVIKEVLRMYGSGPAPLPRTVPKGNGTLDIQGYKIPVGTTVLTQSWTTHRREDVYADATEFKPERWQTETVEMRSNFFPFGLGSRVCGGQNLAMTNARIAIATLIRNFDVVAPPQTTASSMYILEAFVSFPAAMKCDMVFVPRAQ